MFSEKTDNFDNPSIMFSYDVTTMFPVFNQIFYF